LVWLQNRTPKTIINITKFIFKTFDKKELIYNFYDKVHKIIFLNLIKEICEKKNITTTKLLNKN